VIEHQGPFWHEEGCPDKSSGRVTYACNCGEREKIEALMRPDPARPLTAEELAEIRKRSEFSIAPDDAMRLLDEVEWQQTKWDAVRDLSVNVLQTHKHWDSMCAATEKRKKAHWPTCYRIHAECLAKRTLGILEDSKSEDGDDDGE
jgi:hypothetical protein